MECPFCRYQIEEVEKFCGGCGKELPKIIKEQINKEIREALKEIQTPQSISTPHQEISSKNKKETDVLSYETDDIRKIRYKKILKDILYDGCITAEELVLLSQHVKTLGLDKIEAQNIQADVAKELNYNIDEEGDLISSGIVLEININKAYFVDEMDDLELRLTNVSDDNFERAYISSYLMNLKTKEEKTMGTIKADQKKTVCLPFSHSRRGNEVVELCMNYLDSLGNPSVYKSEFRVRVLSREEEKSGTKSINISFAAEKIMGNDFSNMAEILEKDKKQAIDKRSSYEETDKQWKRLPVFFDEDETNRKRNELLINKKQKEGEGKFNEGLQLKKDAERIDKNPAIETFRSAFNLLQESKECFTKILQTDPDNAFSLNAPSLEKINEIGRVIAEIESKIGILEKISTAPAVRLSSGCLTISGLKRVYLFSKERIRIGRDSNNDIALRIIPCKPKEQYPENWQKSREISSTHAEILNRAGQFYIKDIGSDGTGSSNGTFLNGVRIKPLEDYPIKDGMRINIARVLDLECSFLGEYKKREKESGTLSSCYTVLGDVADSCFGIDKVGSIDAIKIRRRNNYTEGEEYIILIREIRIGRSKSNGIAIDDEKVSDIHARLFYRDNQYWIEDLNSRQGTWINGEKIMQGAEAPLGVRSDIMLGDAQLHFEGFE